MRIKRIRKSSLKVMSYFAQIFSKSLFFIKKDRHFNSSHKIFLSTNT